jgi:pimeloyl-ACP methyl ester carboxylesterase
MNLPEPSRHRFTSQGLDLSYVEWGDPAAQLVILVHGSRDHARSWDWTASVLMAEGWRVVAPDLRGHGDSQWSPDSAYVTSYQVNDLADLIDTIGVPRFALVGHSFGGTVCARYAAMFPERVERLVLMEGFGPAPAVFARWNEEGSVARSRQWLEARRKALARPAQVFGSVEAAIAQMRAANPDLSDEQVVHLGRHAVRPQGQGWVWKSDPQMRHFPPEDHYAETEDVWRSIVSPTLAIRGSRGFLPDPFTDGRCDLIADCCKVTIDNAGHWPHHEQFDTFVAELVPFLNAKASA